MAVKVKQMRYVKDGDTQRNYPANLTAEMLISGAMFDGSIRISSLKISGGTFGIKFYLNDTPTALSTRFNGLYDEKTRGMWSFDTKNVPQTSIYNLRFDAQSIQTFIEANNILSEEESLYLFIDYEYESVV